jgi:hypothetical protein
MREKKLASHRRRVRQDLDDLKEKYNSDAVALDEMDFDNVKSGETVSKRDVW